MTKDKKKPRLRFAPSPTGHLHIGHAASAFFTWDQAEQNPESFLLRLEDIDAARCRPEFERSIKEDLHWLEIEWKNEPRRQSEHWEDYKKKIEILKEKELLYPCFCTRKDILKEGEGSVAAPHGPGGSLYPGRCKNLDRGERDDRLARGDPYALRLNMSLAIRQASGPLTWFDRGKGRQKAAPEILGDVVLARKDVPASYHLCVTHDDALQDITLVTRGEDLWEATHLHRLLQDILGYPVPEYHHHPLLLDRHGVRFAKRDRGVTLRQLKEKGFSPQDLRLMIQTRCLDRLDGYV